MDPSRAGGWPSRGFSGVGRECQAALTLSLDKEDKMKRFLAIVAIATIFAMPAFAFSATIDVSVIAKAKILPGSNFILTADVKNNGDKIDKATIALDTVEGKPLGSESGFTLLQGNAAKFDIIGLERGKTQVFEFQLSASSSVRPGTLKTTFKIEAGDAVTIGEGTIEVSKPVVPTNLVKPRVEATFETSPNTNFAYIIKVENPKSTEGGSMDMLEVKVEILDINGKTLKELTPDEAQKESFFRPIFGSPLAVSPEGGKIAPGDTFDAKFMLSSGPNIEEGTYNPTIKVSWQPVETNLPAQTMEVKGEIKVASAAWYTVAVRWFIDMVAKTIGFGNYALAIILLAIIVKLLFTPLTTAQFKNMAKMAKVQPILNELKKKYPGKENAQKLQEEQLKVYKEHNINFMSGCLPLLVQLPIIMALYSGISGYGPLNYANFLWLPSLGLTDPIYIMPILLAGSTWLQQKVSTMPGQEQQNMSFQIMFPAIMFLFGINFPSGISLYWFMFNLATIAHQMLYNKGAFGTWIPSMKMKLLPKETKNVK